jgi:ubiquinone/menaquinone biosynthesis C-methylase UbiE
MDHKEVGRYWNGNAEAWTAIARAGFDIYRDYLNTPAFFSILPDVQGKSGLDIGCGEGYNTRLLSDRGATMTAIDISEIFIENAIEEERQTPRNISYAVASAVDLPYADRSFDFATSFMCLMDIPEVEVALAEAFRVVKPGGFFQFSITHPCFDTPSRGNKKDLFGKTYAIEVSDYFRTTNGEIEEWIFGAAPEALKARFSKFRVPKFCRTLSLWVNAVIAAGFVIEAMNEPYPSDEVVKRQPRLADAQKVAYFLQLRCRKSNDR